MFRKANQQQKQSVPPSPFFNTPPSPNFSFFSLIQRQLYQISPNLIYKFCQILHPIPPFSLHLYNLFEKQLLDYFHMKIQEGNKYVFVENEVLNHAKGINVQLSKKIATLVMNKQLQQKLRQNTDNKPHQSNPKTNPSYGTPSKIPTQNSSKPHNPPYNSNNITPTNLIKNKTLPNPSQNIPTKKSLELPQNNATILSDNNMRDKGEEQNLISKIPQEIHNLRQCLVCQKLITDSQTLSSIFTCTDCGKHFHSACMPRFYNCFFCQLQNINPFHQPIHRLFNGFLFKSVSKHVVKFQLTQAHIHKYQSSHPQPSRQQQSNNFPLIQLRSIRIKDTYDPLTSYINLFPDSCKILVNNEPIRQFHPLQQGSSSKYRRDQCINISQYLRIGQNTINIQQNIQNITNADTSPDQIIKSQKHFVAIYIIQNIQFPQLDHNQTINTNFNKIAIQKFIHNFQITITDFHQSQTLLKQSIGQQQAPPNPQNALQSKQELSCNNKIIRLISPSTFSKMVLPGRTIFCTHLACFDIYNCILLNSNAKLPNWKCSICKAPAYKFKVDCIINYIVFSIKKLLQNSANKWNSQQVERIKNINEITFDKFFNIKLLSKNIKLQTNPSSNKPIFSNNIITQLHWITNIYNLPIEGKSKRPRQNCQIDQLSQGNLLKKCNTPMNSSTLKNNNQQIQYQGNGNANTYANNPNISSNVPTNIIPCQKQLKLTNFQNTTQPSKNREQQIKHYNTEQKQRVYVKQQEIQNAYSTNPCAYNRNKPSTFRNHQLNQSIKQSQQQFQQIKNIQQNIIINN